MGCIVTILQDKEAETTNFKWLSYHHQPEEAEQVLI